MEQMNCATHRRGSDHLLPLDPDEYRGPPQRFQSQIAKIRVERQNSKVGDHDSQLLAQKIVASATRRGYAGNGQLTVFSTGLIF